MKYVNIYFNNSIKIILFNLKIQTKKYININLNK